MTIKQRIFPIEAIERHKKLRISLGLNPTVTSKKTAIILPIKPSKNILMLQEWDLLSSENELVKLYVSRINRKLNLVLITTLTGHIGFPVNRKLEDLCKLTAKQALSLYTDLLNESINNTGIKLGLHQEAC